MKLRNIALTLMVLMQPIGSLAATPDQAETDREAVEKSISQFYVALDDMFKGDVDRMRQVWSHADDVTYMGPGGGMLVGWKKVVESWEVQAAMKLGGAVTPADVQITVGRDLAVAQNYEVGENKVAGETQKVSIRVTNVFRKEAGEWKMIGHHTDLLPFLQK